VSGETKSVNQEEVEAWKNTFLPHLMAKYSQKGMFSMDFFMDHFIIFSLTEPAYSKEKPAKA
jgi:hypothetical protein